MAKAWLSTRGRISIAVATAAVAATAFGTAPAHAAYPGDKGGWVACNVRVTTATSDVSSIYVAKDGANDAPVPLGLPGPNAYSPAWSPDGTKLAFVSDSGGRVQIWTSAADGTGARQLTFGTGGNASAPSFSPDGQRIIFAGAGYGPASIFEIDVDGTGLRGFESTANVSFSDPKYSPDGTTILLSRATIATKGDIYAMDADGSNLRPVLATSASESEADWSPDSTQITYVRHVGSAGELMIAGADGADARRIWDGSSASMRWPVFSPDGQRIAYSGRGNSGTFTLRTISVDGTGPRVIGVVAGGAAQTKSWQPTPPPTTGPDHMIYGKQLDMRALPRSPFQSMAMTLEDPALVTIADVRTAPVSLRLVGPQFDVSFELPGENWRAVLGPEGPRRYEYRDKDGAIHSARITVRTGRVEIDGRAADLGFVLASDPEMVRAMLTIGTDRYCAAFGGRTHFLGGRFIARQAPEPADCGA